MVISVYLNISESLLKYCPTNGNSCMVIISLLEQLLLLKMKFLKICDYTT